MVVPVAMHGAQVTLTIPSNACALHGPDTPPTKMGEPPLRPRDADVTGGYYQPVSVEVPAAAGDAGLGFVLERIGCNLPNVSLDVVQAFQKRYQPNINPALAGLTVQGAAASPVVEGTAPVPLVVGANTIVTMEAAWTAASARSFPGLRRRRARHRRSRRRAHRLLVRDRRFLRSGSHRPYRSRDRVVRHQQLASARHTGARAPVAGPARQPRRARFSRIPTNCRRLTAVRRAARTDRPTSGLSAAALARGPPRTHKIRW